jgi:hypothetical protein
MRTSVSILLVLAGCAGDPVPVSSAQLCEELAAASDCASEQCGDVVCTGGVVGDGDLAAINYQCPSWEPTARASQAAIDAVGVWCWDERRLSFGTMECMVDDLDATWVNCVQWQGD